MPSPAPTPGSPAPADLVTRLPTRGRAPGRGAPRAAALCATLGATLAAGVLLVGCAVGGGAERVSGEQGLAGGPVGVAAEPAPARLRASGVLAAWDRARARAFADGNVHALRGLYVPGSAAGTTDLKLLRAYRARGLRVKGMRMQLLAVAVLHETPRVLRLRVTDRLTGAVVVGRQARRALPRDHASTRVMELRRSPAGRWRVAWVRQ